MRMVLRRDSMVRSPRKTRVRYRRPGGGISRANRGIPAAGEDEKQTVSRSPFSGSVPREETERRSGRPALLSRETLNAERSGRSASALPPRGSPLRKQGPDVRLVAGPDVEPGLRVLHGLPGEAV